MINYRAYFAGEGPVGGYQLWVTDGTAQGTNELPVANADASGLDPQGLGAFGGSVLFGGVDSNGLYNLYISNGTAAGTTELTAAGAHSGGLFAWSFVEGRANTLVTTFLAPSFTVLGRQALFVGIDANDLFQLWSTDGTSAGTNEIVVPTAASFGLHPSEITTIGGKAVFSGYDAASRDALWVTDGTSSGTFELAPYVGAIAAYGNRALFAAAGGLGITDGTLAGTQVLTPSGAAGAPNDPGYFALLGTSDVFVAADASGRSELWITDGTGAGTHEITPSGADASGLFVSYEVNTLTVLGSQVLFAGYAADGTRQLWVSDGTSAGTVALPVAGAASTGLDPSEITVIGHQAVFLGVDQSGATTLWVTDGTAAGTHAIPAAGVDGIDLTRMGGEAVFLGSLAGGPAGLGVTDGTAAGTHLIQTPTANPGAAATLAPAPALSPRYLTAVASTQANVYGAASGGGTIMGTAGDDYIHGYGLGNTIYTGGGSDFINTGAGSATVYLESGDPAEDGSITQASPAQDGGEGLDETVNLGGSGNTILGGSENDSIVGGTGNNSVTVGSGNDLISLFGSGNQVTLGSGVSTVRFTGGSATATLTDYGDTPAYLYDTTVLFTGTGNTLNNTAGSQSQGGFSGDPGTMRVTGGSGGGNFDLGWSTATLVTGGTGNIVHAGQGVSDITPGSGSDTVDLEASYFFNQIGGDVTVHLAGQDNVVQGVAHTLTVTGGNGGGTFDLVGRSQFSYVGFAPLTRSYTVTTGGADNSFALDGGFTNTIFTGYGGAHVTVANPVTMGFVTVPLASTAIALGRTGNTVVGGDAPITITGGNGASSVTLGNGADSITTAGPSNTVVVGDGDDSIAPGSDLANVHAGDGNDGITIAGGGDTVVAGNGDDTVRGSASAAHVTLGDGSDVFLLTGRGNFLTAGNGADSFTLGVNTNTVVAGNGDDTVTGGGGGNNSVTLGSGHDTVQMVGWGNSITVGAGVDSIEGGYGFATFSLTGSTATLALHDRNDTVTLNATTHATITDQSSNALLRVTAGDVQAMIAGFGASTGAKLDLVGGIGGYANAQQVLAALHGDGHGGSLLSLGGAGFVDFTTVAPGALHAANFLF